ncbi:universal stress protein [Nocardioides cynanchi]|uniref:universal stress protein n=1 Tax=Nocardioides cynanchi TaxID=2558918 RepID=UPI0012441AA2|nr:universal stress protein [Nocardioides cynanchi]
MTPSASPGSRGRSADDPPVIVVGVDGSQGSAAALDFALSEGHSRGLGVELVTGWLANPRQAGPGATSPVDAGRALALALQDLELSAALARGLPRPPVTHVVVHDHPGRVLAARSAGAAMVVVGSGRMSSASRKVLGSVGEYCLRHSSAPVVVVPEPREAHAEAAAS